MNNPPRKPWSQMTRAEIAELKKRQCVKCKYFSRSVSDATASTCDYITFKKHSRGCDPRDCMEKGVFVPKSGKRRPQSLRLQDSPKTAYSGLGGSGR